MNPQLFIILLKRGLGFWDTFLQPPWWRRIPHLLHHLCTSANNCAGSALQQSQNKLSWVCATSAQGFLLLVCPCWCAWPLQAAVPSGALLGAWQWEQWAGLWPPSRAGLHGTYRDSVTILLEIRRDGTKQGHLAGSAEWINCRFPCWWTWPASHFSRCLSLGIECFLDASSLCLSGANASTMEIHISSLTSIRNCWPADELLYVTWVPWKNRS